MNSEIEFSSIHELSTNIAARRISCVEVTTRVLERIDKFGSRLNCYITVQAERALEHASALDALLASGVWLGPLHGIPIGLKDNVATAGVRTTAGSGVLANWIPERDAAVVAKLKRAGAVIIGKQSLYEFAYGYWHKDFGETRNPWDQSKCCGASSSGSACAVSAGLAYGSIGTDTGGSIRLPAAVCGVVGLKPTNGLVSRAGVIPASYDLDCVGPLARTVRDVAIQLQVIAGYDADSPGSVRNDVPNYLDGLEIGVRGVAIGVPRDREAGHVDVEVQAAFEKALDVLQGEGAVLVDVDLPDLSLAYTANLAIQFGEASDYHRRYVMESPEKYTDIVRQRILVGAFVPATLYVRAQRVRAKFRAEYKRLMTEVDVIALPTLPIPAWAVGAKRVSVNGGAPADPRSVFTRHTPIFSLTGQPAISIPCGFNHGGLPLAFQLAGRWLDEALLLRTARAYERVTPWHQMHPPLN